MNTALACWMSFIHSAAVSKNTNSAESKKTGKSFENFPVAEFFGESTRAGQNPDFLINEKCRPWKLPK